MKGHLFLGEKSFQKLGLMDDFKIAPELGIFMFQAVVAMGAGGEDLLDVIPFKRLNVLFYEHGVKVFVARPAGRIPATPFFGTENAK